MKLASYGHSAWQLLLFLIGQIEQFLVFWLDESDAFLDKVAFSFLKFGVEKLTFAGESVHTDLSALNITTQALKGEKIE